MLDVFLLGMMVAYFRLRSSLEVTLGAGAICFIIAGLLSLVARATLDKAQVWRLISPDRRLIRSRACVLELRTGDASSGWSDYLPALSRRRDRTQEKILLALYAYCWPRA